MKLKMAVTPERIQQIVGRYYGVKRIREEEGEFEVEVEDIDFYPEDYFSMLVSDLRKMGYVAFTRTKNEIIIIEEPERSRRSLLKILMAIATVITLFYVGYSYVSSYFSSSPLMSVLETLIYFVIPVFIILGSREFGRYLGMKRNSMQYSFPIFVPDPIGMGTMGSINAPNVAYPSKRAMVESSLLSVVFGFLASLIFVIIGGYLSLMLRIPVSGVRSPILQIGSPLIFQAAMRSFVPSDGVLFPTAYAGWVGIIVSAFNAMPIGFLDGGLISSAMLGKYSQYVAYVAIVAIIGLSILYPSWLILLVFVLIIGIRGPEPLNNVGRASGYVKILALSIGIIILIGLVPIPFHTLPPQFSVSYGQTQFVVYSVSANISTNVSCFLNVSNHGTSPITPGFSISPAIPISVKSSSRSVSPSASQMFNVTIYFTKSSPGFYSYVLSVFTSTASELVNIHIYFIELTENFTMKSNNPLVENATVNDTKRIPLTSDTSSTLMLNVYAFGSSGMDYHVVVQNAVIAEGENFPFMLDGGASFLILVNSTIPQTVYVIVYDQQYQGDVAVINFVNTTSMVHR
ncbi:site-2 protease family protein [Thermoplasma sp. Kam2015]|uniref:site-2 protease family protein n=1 Tax=Thermoplasma sp. Kam2015 TaxID=2094122 RepID=UPI001F239111|nr:site-2 protease family protein [Thermoplasma sp. Kam2015]